MAAEVVEGIFDVSLSPTNAVAVDEEVFPDKVCVEENEVADVVVIGVARDVDVHLQSNPSP